MRAGQKYNLIPHLLFINCIYTYFQSCHSTIRFLKWTAQRLCVPLSSCKGKCIFDHCRRAAVTSFSTTHIFRVLTFIKMLLAGITDSSGTLQLLSWKVWVLHLETIQTNFLQPSRENIPLSIQKLPLSSKNNSVSLIVEHFITSRRTCNSLMNQVSNSQLRRHKANPDGFAFEKTGRKCYTFS